MRLFISATIWALKPLTRQLPVPWGSEFASAGCCYLCSWWAGSCEWAGQLFSSILLLLLFGTGWETLEATSSQNTMKEVVGSPWSQGAPHFETVSSTRRLLAGKMSVSIASRTGNQLIPVLLNQHFQRRAVRSEAFSPNIMSRTVKAAYIAGEDFEKAID